MYFNYTMSFVLNLCLCVKCPMLNIYNLITLHIKLHLCPLYILRSLELVETALGWVSGNALESLLQITCMTLAEAPHPPENQISSYNKGFDQVNSAIPSILRTRIS